jgi:hypothetical protein
MDYTRDGGALRRASMSASVQVFERRPPQRVEGVIMPVSKNLQIIGHDEGVGLSRERPDSDIGSQFRARAFNSPDDTHLPSSPPIVLTATYAN